jgi:hypothetical protein
MLIKEHNTVEHNPAGLSDFARLQSSGSNQTPLFMRSIRDASSAENPEMMVIKARDIARRIVLVLPPLFDRVMPRGYTVSSGMLIMTKFQHEGAGHLDATLYGRHESWGIAESREFLNDLHQGWLGELASFMRWQLRDNRKAFDIFQQALQALTNAD